MGATSAWKEGDDHEAQVISIKVAQRRKATAVVETVKVKKKGK